MLQVFELLQQASYSRTLRLLLGGLDRLPLVKQLPFSLLESFIQLLLLLKFGLLVGD